MTKGRGGRDLLIEIQKQLKKRQWGEVIRLEVEDKIDKRLLKILKTEFNIKDDDLFFIPGPLDLTFLMKMYGLEGYEAYKTPKYVPAPVPALQNDDDIFTNIRRGDILLHHPYMSFDPVVDFVRQAARDPEVLAIKQTLYRVSGNSPIIAALAQAAENGKQVSVLVELKARFDEENNIVWAKMLEKAGCHVIYGLLGLKVHSKITLVVRREEEGIRRYVHLGTGNYNDSTAKQYTDCGILTCDAKIGEDATAVFNMLSGYSEPSTWNKLVVAPIWMRNRFLHMIRMEEEHARNGQEARIVAKINSLCDQEIIAALYSASAAGVKIDLIVRGICCLITGIPGISENITVRSIVGNFLEHARIFYFYSNGNEEVYMGSADWMPRNLDKRVEIVFPVEDPQIKKEVMNILKVQLEDNMKAHVLQPDGLYVKPDRRGKTPVCAQEYFCQEAQEKAKEKKAALDKRVFIPAEPVGKLTDKKRGRAPSPKERRVLLYRAPAQALPERIRDFQISLPDAKINIRFVGTVKIRSAGDAEAMAFCQLLHGGFLRKTVGGIDGLQSLKAAAAEKIHQFFQLPGTQTVEQGGGPAPGGRRIPGSAGQLPREESVLWEQSRAPHLPHISENLPP